MKPEIISIINHYTSLVKMPLRLLVQEIQDWEENRVLNDEKKINEIIENYRKRDIVLITSLFRAVQFPNGKQLLLDGHHRKEAAKELLKEYPNFDENIDILIIIHYRSNDNDLNDIYDIHIKANLCQPLDDKQVPNAKRTELIKLFKEHPILKNGISQTSNCKTARQPKISKNELAELAGEIIIKYPLMIPELIIRNIKEINNRLSLIFTIDNYIQLSLTGSKLKPEIITKAHSSHFYLNMKDSKFNKDYWINYIDKPNEISFNCD